MVFIPFSDFLFAGSVLEIFANGIVNKIINIEPKNEIPARLFGIEADNIKIVVAEIVTNNKLLGRIVEECSNLIGNLVVTQLELCKPDFITNMKVSNLLFGHCLLPRFLSVSICYHT